MYIFLLLTAVTCSDVSAHTQTGQPGLLEAQFQKNIESFGPHFPNQQLVRLLDLSVGQSTKSQKEVCDSVLSIIPRAGKARSFWIRVLQTFIRILNPAFNFTTPRDLVMHAKELAGRAQAEISIAKREFERAQQEKESLARASPRVAMVVHAQRKIAEAIGEYQTAEEEYQNSIRMYEFFGQRMQSVAAEISGIQESLRNAQQQLAKLRDVLEDVKEMKAEYFREMEATKAKLDECGLQITQGISLMVQIQSFRGSDEEFTTIFLLPAQEQAEKKITNAQLKESALKSQADRANMIAYVLEKLPSA